MARRPTVIFIISAILFGAATLFISKPHLSLAEEQPSTWLSESDPTLTLTETLPPGGPITDYVEPLVCTDRTFTIRPKKTIIVWPFKQDEKTLDVCAIDTQFGALGNDYLHLEGTEVAGELTLAKNNPRTYFRAIPRSANIFRYDIVNGRTRLELIEDFRSKLASSNTSAGEVIYYPKSGTTGKLVTSFSGAPLAVEYSTSSYSYSGEWMVVDTHMGTVRYNTVTGDVLPFKTRQTYQQNSKSFIHTAITNNGRYAVTSSGLPAYMRIYDLATCQEGLDWYDTIESCQYKELYPFLKTQIPKYSSSSYIRFLDNNNLDLYITWQREGDDWLKRERYTLTAPNSVVFGQDSPSFGYLALGDSFASGEGAYKYKAFTDVRDNKCHLSLVSYPYLLMEQLGLGLSESVACSGAKIQDIADTSVSYNDRSQAKGKSESRYTQEILKQFLPGYRAQLKFLQDYKPSVITVSVGGNDIGFAKKIKYCVESGDCYPTYEDRVEVLYEVDRLSWRLIDTFKQLKKAAHPKSKIYVLGYPSIVKPGGNCGLNVRLSQTELLFADHLTIYLNNAVERAAKWAGVYYVDIEDALNGHRLCETQDVNTAVNGITAGDEPTKILFFEFDGPLGRESFHPNELGHRHYAKTIRQKTNDFTAEMPEPDTTEYPPAKDDLVILNVHKSGRDLNLANFDSDTENNVIYKVNKGAEQRQKINQGHNFKPNSRVFLKLYSDPIDLGTIELDDNGEAEFTLDIPGNVPAGYHMLHIYGINMAGENIDVQRLLFVAETVDDWDGDGVLNTDEVCKYGEPSGFDYDKDEIDDACDGYIGEPEPLITSYEESGEAEELPGFVAATTGPTTRAIFNGSPVTNNPPVSIRTNNEQRMNVLGSEAASLFAAGDSSTPKTKAWQSTKSNNSWLIFIISIIAVSLLGGTFAAVRVKHR